MWSAFCWALRTVLTHFNAETVLPFKFRTRYPTSPSVRTSESAKFPHSNQESTYCSSSNTLPPLSLAAAYSDRRERYSNFTRSTASWHRNMSLCVIRGPETVTVSNRHACVRARPDEISMPSPFAIDDASDSVEVEYSDDSDICLRRGCLALSEERCVCLASWCNLAREVLRISEV